MNFRLTYGLSTFLMLLFMCIHYSATSIMLHLSSDLKSEISENVTVCMLVIALRTVELHALAADGTHLEVTAIIVTLT